MTEPTDHPTTASELREEIEQTRAELADSVEALADKVDVPAKIHHQVDHAKEAIAEVSHKIGDATPEPVHTALHRAGAAAAPVVDKAKPYRKQIGLAALVAGTVAIVTKRRRRG